MRKEIWTRAVTIKEISGRSIKTIPVGTEFEVLTDILVESPRFDEKYVSALSYGGLGYATCRGISSPFGITSIWLTEFKLTPIIKETETPTPIPLSKTEKETLYDLLAKLWKEKYAESFEHTDLSWHQRQDHILEGVNTTVRQIVGAIVRDGTDDLGGFDPKSIDEQIYSRRFAAWKKELDIVAKEAGFVPDGLVFGIGKWREAFEKGLTPKQAWDLE